jgi:hypothetical protein
MNNLKRNKRWLYLCNQYIENDRKFFDKPQKIKVNYQPIADKDMGQILAVGPEYTNRLIVYMRPEVAKKFHNFDRCYVFIDPPTKHDKTCQNADFYVDGHPTRYLNESTVHLQRMTGADDNG